MTLKKYKPVTPSQRGLVLVDKKSLWKGRPEKSLTVGKRRTGGRNNLGRITSWHKGGGNKRLYRIIDFKRNRFEEYAEIVRIEYDPNRTAFIALIKYENGDLAYILAPHKMEVGGKILASKKLVDVDPGNAMPLEIMPTGTIVHNVELFPGRGGQLARSAGSYAQLVSKDAGYALLKLKSGEQRKVLLGCMATVGVVSNSDHQNAIIGKAGRNRWLGKRPVVRGVAMNPVDHPHGGGQGKTSGGRHPVTPWGKPTKGKKTRKNKSTSKYILRNRRQVKKD
jgi:large subunit ribosomal protein L2